MFLMYEILLSPVFVIIAGMLLGWFLAMFYEEEI